MRAPRRATIGLALAAVFMVLLAASPALAVPEPPAPCLRPPVGAPVLDGFRSPWCLWCAGNRGLEYATAPGTPVRAGAGGVVAFAGPVAPATVEAIFPSPGRCTLGDQGETIVVTGSIYLIGEVLARLEPGRGEGEGRLQDF